MATDPGGGTCPTTARRKGKKTLVAELSPVEGLGAGKYYGAHTAGCWCHALVFVWVRGEALLAGLWPAAAPAPGPEGASRLCHCSPCLLGGFGRVHAGEGPEHRVCRGGEAWSLALVEAWRGVFPGVALPIFTTPARAVSPRMPLE